MAFRRGQAHYRAIRLGHRVDRPRRTIHQPRSQPSESRIEFARKRLAIARRLLPLGHVLHRAVVEAVKKLRVHFADSRHHFAQHVPRLGGRIVRRLHPPQPVEHDSGNCVHHCGERGDRQDVTRHFDRALFRLPLDLLDAPCVRHRANVPYVAQDRARRRLHHPRQLAIVFPPSRDCFLVDGALLNAELRARRGNVGLRAVQPHVALALLLGIVKRVRVEKRPDELPAHIFESEFEMRVLVNGVMPAKVGSRTDRHALLIGDFLGNYQVRRVARPRRRNRRIERVRERVAQRHARRGSLHLRSNGCVGNGGQLRGHLHGIIRRMSSF